MSYLPGTAAANTGELAFLALLQSILASYLPGTAADNTGELVSQALLQPILMSYLLAIVNNV